MKNYLIISLLAVFVLVGCAEEGRITIHTIGDSTMAIKSDRRRPETGWGEGLPLMFDTLVTIDNHAVNGRSTRSFINEGRWQKVYDNLKAGDIVLIQFGHNDAKINDSARFTNPSTQYRANLMRFISDSRKKGAKPILLTSIVRRNFTEDGVLVDTHGVYPEVMRSVAFETGTPLIDAQTMSEELVLSFGPDSSKALYLHLQPGENPNFANGVTDDTHLNGTGAMEICNLIVEKLIAIEPRLGKHIL